MRRNHEKGGGGEFLWEMTRMLLMGLWLWGGYLVYFVRFCALFATFWRVRSGLASMEFAPGLFLLLCAFGEELSAKMGGFCCGICALFCWV